MYFYKTQCKDCVTIVGVTRSLCIDHLYIDVTCSHQNILLAEQTHEHTFRSHSCVFLGSAYDAC